MGAPESPGGSPWVPVGLRASGPGGRAAFRGSGSVGCGWAGATRAVKRRGQSSARSGQSAGAAVREFPELPLSTSGVLRNL